MDKLILATIRIPVYDTPANEEISLGEVRNDMLGVISDGTAGVEIHQHNEVALNLGRVDGP